jgi:hypothetical protein
MSKQTFIKYLGGMALGGFHIAAYDDKHGVTIRVEKYSRTVPGAMKKFDSIEDAEDFVAKQPGNQAGRMANALHSLGVEGF